MKDSLEFMRENYKQHVLLRENMPANPYQLFEEWIKTAIDSGVHEANAMTLATVNSKGRPSARIVLLKGISENGFSFYTNYESQKGQELQENPFAALVFLWKENERQVRIEGSVTKMSKEESQKYFDSRPRESRISAISSPQSQIISDYQELLDRRQKVSEDLLENQEIAVPNYWGGFILNPDKIEFWQGRPNRFHDRFVYTKKDKIWSINRLAP